MEKITHDRLQSRCFLFLWNEHPELRYLAHANFNNLTTQVPNARAVMGRLKSLGLVKGILDLEFYYKGCLYVFDFKIGKDKLSKEQKAHISAIEAQGGKGYEIRSLEQFQKIIENIL